MQLDLVKSNRESVGYIQKSPKLDNIFIAVPEPIDADSRSWSGDNGLFICAPATNRDEAKERIAMIEAKSEFMYDLFKQRSK